MKEPSHLWEKSQNACNLLSILLLEDVTQNIGRTRMAWPHILVILGVICVAFTLLIVTVTAIVIAATKSKANRESGFRRALRTCPGCGVQLPSDAPEGLCPRCLLRHVMPSTSAPVGVEPGEAPTLPPPATPQSAFRNPALPTAAELGSLFPQLEILERFGQGGMGAVYKARQRGLDRLVALKILPPQDSRDPAFAERFSREARALAKLSHPNIVGVHDFGEIVTAHESGERGGLFYFIMEYVDGANLRQLLHAKQLTPAEAMKIVPPICEALQYAHDEGIVHRNIKPENILVDKKGRVKIADFGLAKLLGRKPEMYTLTGPWQVMGTPHYMAPEQMEKPLAVDHRADIYSLGVVLYEMLTGELPLGRFLPPSQKVHIDVRLDEIVLKTLEKEPERRYQHVSEVKTSVESIYGTSPAALRMYGYEYRSKTTLFGLPLVHIATGMDPRTGRKRIAKGIIAIGDVAVGMLAIGGCAFGGIAIGGAAIGLITLGGVSIGLLFALGGGAIGTIAVGGAAIGVVAFGGGALGYYAAGGGAWGVHAYGGNVQDPEVIAFFENQGWLEFLINWFGALSLLVVLLFVVLAVGLSMWAKMKATRV